MKSKEQKLIIDNLLSSREIYSRCAGIVDSRYFDPEYRNIVQFIKDYTDKYGATPTVDVVNAKHDSDHVIRTVTSQEVKSSCDDIEVFCQDSAMRVAIYESIEELEVGNHAAVRERVNEASLVSLSKDMGVDMFDDPEGYLMGLLDTDVVYSTGINGFDDNLDGGLVRKQLTLFSANSGGGKSVMLSNLGARYSIFHGLNVVYISLELAEPMIVKRNAFIMSGVHAKHWKEKIGFIGSTLQQQKASGAGSFRVKRLPTGCNVNHIRSYLKQYEIEYGYTPDVIIVDYLDLLSPNGGIGKNSNISDQDKQKSEELSQLLHDYDAIGISASQQNRDALKTQAPDQSVIAGGMTKVNTVDNFISLYMDAGLRSKGEMMGFFLKTRSSDGVGKMVPLSFDTTCLRIGDYVKQGGMAQMATAMKARKPAKGANAEDNKPKLTQKIEGLPGLPEQDNVSEKVENFLDKIETDVKIVTGDKKREKVADLSRLTKADAKKKTKVALSLLDEEEAITSYNKKEDSAVDETPNPSKNSLTEEQNEFIKSHNLSEKYVEYVMSFME
jgi:KaiC/GvpD/RAD55 family RecA-like ATPase